MTKRNKSAVPAVSLWVSVSDSFLSDFMFTHLSSSENLDYGENKTQRINAPLVAPTGHNASCT